MKKIAAIVRADCGGLGSLARSFSDRLGFYRTVSLSRHPGEHYPHWYPRNRVAADGLTVELLAWLCDGADVLLSFETWYGDLAPRVARRMGVRTALVPMYECCPLARAGLEQTELAICPSRLDWYEMERTPGLAAARRVFLPIPFDVERIAFRRRRRARVFLHSMGHGGIGGRNGTQRVIEAWRHVKSNARLVVRHQSPLPTDDLPRDERITCLSGPAASGVENYWDLWSEGDVLLHPHRWDGLSLPIQEALAAGMPVMTTRYWPFCDAGEADEVAPEHREGWLPPSSRRMAIDVTSTTRQRICREITAHETTPQAIAAAVDAWYDADISAASDESREYAEHLSWRRLLPEYRRLFDGLCEAWAVGWGAAPRAPDA
ncbi:MAG TPA: hypothetical protein VMV10_12160 [Pirellulales bacterium]|nr:hypothetical protein [Pirellulales bacterium]